MTVWSRVKTSLYSVMRAVIDVIDLHTSYGEVHAVNGISFKAHARADGSPPVEPDGQSSRLLPRADVGACCVTRGSPEWSWDPTRTRATNSCQKRAL